MREKIKEKEQKKKDRNLGPCAVMDVELIKFTAAAKQAAAKGRPLSMEKRTEKWIEAFLEGVNVSLQETGHCLAHLSSSEVAAAVTRTRITREKLLEKEMRARAGAQVQRGDGDDDK